jgi:hypothetical protein
LFNELPKNIKAAIQTTAMKPRSTAYSTMVTPSSRLIRQRMRVEYNRDRAATRSLYMGSVPLQAESSATYSGGPLLIIYPDEPLGDVDRVLIRLMLLNSLRALALLG